MSTSLFGITLYGIPNCDQVKKARTWLSENKFNVDFHDFKKAGASEELIDEWLKQVDWQTLLNRRGTTWRKFSEAEQASIVDAESAKRCMSNSPSVIKRPVLVTSNAVIIVGFSEASYEQLLHKQT